MIVLGFHNTTASYGANGFTADHRAALKRAKTGRVYCAYDADPAGDHAADQLAHDLANHGIEVFRVQLPCKDPNDFIKGGGTKEQFQELLDRAVVMVVPGINPVPSAAAPESPATPNEPPSPSWTFELALGDRTYRIETAPQRTDRSLIVVLRITRGERTHVDTLNLYLDRDRAKFINRAYMAFRGQVSKKIIEEDFFAVLDEVEKLIQPEPSADPVSSSESMSAAEREEALSFLGQPDLIDRIVLDLAIQGVVGEDDNKLLAYLVATSRKLDKPLSLSVISGASAGKSWLLNRVVDLMPPEDVLRYTRVSPRALFYDEPGRYKHKVLFIEEAIGAKDADLSLRAMQSERRLSNLATMTDPKTGQLKTQETITEGPLVFLTSSVEPLDHETATRSFEIAIDESAEQTKRILEKLRKEHGPDGFQQALIGEAILRKHRNAQKLLEPLYVLNPFVDSLEFPTDTLRLRREAGKYFWLIDTIAFLHQHQRKQHAVVHDGAMGRYVEVTPEDIDVANRLMVSCLARALSDLPGPAQELLMKIRELVMKQAEQRGSDPLAITFNRREVREWVKWSDYQVRVYLDLLVEFEYIEAASGSFGKRYVYTLGENHRLLVQSGMSLEEKVKALGLTPASELKKVSGSASYRN